MISHDNYPEWDKYSKPEQPGLKNKLPEYDPYTGDRNPYLIDTKVPTKSTSLSPLFYIFLFGTITSCFNIIMCILLQDPIMEIMAWSCAVVYSIGCSIYEFMRCKRIL
jgi:hypothetical protein